MFRRSRRKIENRFVSYLNNLSVRRKLLVLYVFCVLIPLIVTDGFIIGMFVRNERNRVSKEMESLAETTANDFSNEFRHSFNTANSIYSNARVREYLETDYSSTSDYTKAYTSNPIDPYITSKTPEIKDIMLCVDNPSIVNGRHFYRINSINDSAWYKEYSKNATDTALIFFYSGLDSGSYMQANTRRIAIIKNMSTETKNNIPMLAVIMLDYPTVVRDMHNPVGNYTVNICVEDRIILSNDGNAYNYVPFKSLPMNARIGYEKTVSLYGTDYRIAVMAPARTTIADMADMINANTVTIIILVLVNIFFPLMMVRLLNSSFTERLRKLSNTFHKAESSVGLLEVMDVEGTDEISYLLEGYNGLVRRNRNLIKTIYEDRLTRQEMEIEKQAAELLSLRMQINPHFFFNVLENIRMHSIVKGETETAYMIERLASLAREIADWKDDVIPLSKEMSFISDYLKLKQYRYGSRFKFNLSADDEALTAYIPKLTLATFVENACVHGVEKKSSDAVIIVDASVKDDRLILEIEDTGAGMSQEKAEKLLETMRTCNYTHLSSSDRIGIINACVRLKVIEGDDVEFYLESEEGIGTYLRIEMKRLKNAVRGFRRKEPSDHNEQG